MCACSIGSDEEENFSDGTIIGLACAWALAHHHPHHQQQQPVWPIGTIGYGKARTVAFHNEGGERRWVRQAVMGVLRWRDLPGSRNSVNSSSSNITNNNNSTNINTINNNSGGGNVRVEVRKCGSCRHHVHLNAMGPPKSGQISTFSWWLASDTQLGARKEAKKNFHADGKRLGHDLHSGMFDLARWIQWAFGDYAATGARKLVNLCCLVVHSSQN